jgi:hypothetical protein
LRERERERRPKDRKNNIFCFTGFQWVFMWKWPFKKILCQMKWGAKKWEFLTEWVSAITVLRIFWFGYYGFILWFTAIIVSHQILNRKLDI